VKASVRRKTLRFLNHMVHWYSMKLWLDIIANLADYECS